MHLVAVFNLLSTTYMFNFISRLHKRDVVLLSPYTCGGVSIKKYMMVWKGYLFCQMVLTPVEPPCIKFGRAAPTPH